MTDQSQRQYLDDVPQQIQDLIYEQRVPEAIQLQMTTKGLGKMEAMMNVGGILSRMQAAFPEAMPEPPPGPTAGISPRTKTVLLWTFLSVFTLVAAAMIFFGVRGLLLGHQSKSWPSVAGKVIASSLEERSRTNSKGRSRDSKRANISYTFTVEGTAFTGDRIDYGNQAGESARANGLVHRYPKGKKVTVYYKAGNPKKCLLEPGLQGKAFTLPGFGLFLLFIAGVLVSAAVSVARDERKAASPSPTGDIFKGAPPG